MLFRSCNIKSPAKTGLNLRSRKVFNANRLEISAVVNIKMPCLLLSVRKRPAKPELFEVSPVSGGAGDSDWPDV